MTLAAWAGGSHGGQPVRTIQPGTIGAVYDSVYRPQMAGGGAAYTDPVTVGAGGGVIDIVAGELVLAGELRARGNDVLVNSNGATGAGGSVQVATGVLSGAGKIDAAGGNFISLQTSGCPNTGSTGGGGRVALLVASFSGFDPAVQVSVEGGRSKHQATGGECLYHAGPGTLYVKTSASTWGDLQIDAGTLAAGGDRPVPPTVLPALGSGAPSAFTAAGADAFLARSGGFAEALAAAPGSSCSTAGGSLLGTFEAVERDGSAQLRLAGAGAAVRGGRLPRPLPLRPGRWCCTAPASQSADLVETTTHRALGRGRAVRPR